MKAGVIGLGDMGSGLAKNLIANGYETAGYDLSAERMAAFSALGGHAKTNPAEVGAHADIVYVMVMNGAQAHDVVMGDDGLARTMAKGGIIILTATIKPSEVRALATAMKDTGLELIDSPVSGGFPGAQNGTLTMMAAAPDALMQRAKPAMQAVSSTIHHVGSKAGDGQVMKSCLQSIIGAAFSATFEAAALAAKAGVPGQVLYDVISTSGAGCGVINTALEYIIDRKFTGTGSSITTMHKDLTISLDMAEELGVPLFTASTAMQIFHMGKAKYPEGDNWICTKLMEEAVGAELHR
ncbi:MAG: NAD(P)-dependent oxidoreductase [Candidatus Puniceispirillaceae bacterium]